MARALYFDADVTVLDDPFTGLDRATAGKIRTRLFTDGLATEGGKTLIMATSMRTLFYSPPYSIRSHCR